jgi:hypothetical protein
MERRKHKRLPITLNVRISNGMEDFEGVIINISTGGIGVITTKHIDPVSNIELNFSLSDTCKFEKIKGNIVRSQSIADEFYYFIGIQFMPDEDVAGISKYLLDKKLEQYSYKMKE